MIDYEKLKLAHELACNSTEWLWVETKYSGQGLSMEFRLVHGFHGDQDDIFCFDDIDKLIEKLQSLIRHKPKYEVGQKVFMVSGKSQIELEILQCPDEYNQGTYEVGYLLGESFRIGEPDLFPTREALIDAQIEYWTSLKKQEKSTGSEDVSKLPTKACEHERDRRIPNHHEFTTQARYICKKCGEFF